MRAASRIWSLGTSQLVRFVKHRPILKATVAAGGFVCAQLSYIQYKYVPLEPPAFGAISGIETCSDHDGCEHYIPADDRPAAAYPRPNKRVLIIGDSLVVGIGCKDEAVMPQLLCKKLAEHLKADISWHSHGINGADLRTMHVDILQHFRENQPRLYRILSTVMPDIAKDEPTRSAGPDDGESRSAASSTRPSQLAQMAADADVVVVMCGLNDFKRLWMGRTASVFRRDLDALLRLIRAQTGRECLVVLPGLPLEETALPQPLKSLAIYIGDRFDAVKADAAAADALVRFVPKPAVDLWRRAKEQAAARAAASAAAAGQSAAGGGAAASAAAAAGILASDGVHPNEAGYAAFGEYLARELAAHMLAAQPPAPAVPPAQLVVH